MKKILACNLLAVLSAATAAAAVPVSGDAELAGTADRVTVETIQYQPDPTVPEISVAVVAGDPKRGTYTIRAKFAPGAKTPAHYHPDERTITVLSGTYYFGVGYRFDEAKLQACGPGTVIVVPAELRHFSWAKDGEVLVQESGVGPTGLVPTGF